MPPASGAANPSAKRPASRATATPATGTSTSTRVTRLRAAKETLSANPSPALRSKPSGLLAKSKEGLRKVSDKMKESQKDKKAPAAISLPSYTQTLQVRWMIAIRSRAAELIQQRHSCAFGLLLPMQLVVRPMRNRIWSLRTTPESSCAPLLLATIIYSGGRRCPPLHGKLIARTLLASTSRPDRRSYTPSTRFSPLPHPNPRSSPRRPSRSSRSCCTGKTA